MAPGAPGQPCPCRVREYQCHQGTLKSVFDWHDWRERGINKVQDIVSGDGLMHFEQLRNKYNLTCTFLKVMHLRAAIPGQWKKCLSTENYQCNNSSLFLQTESGKDKDLMILTTNEIYWMLCREKGSSPTCQKAWNKDYDDPELFTKENWNAWYQLPFVTLRDTKIQTFAYKIINRTTPCRRYLKQIRAETTEECMFCGEVDDLTHFFLDCPDVKAFWSALHRWTTYAEVNVHLHEVSQVEALLGIPNKSKEFKLTNYILIMGKYYIHRQRLFYNNELNMYNFLVELKQKLLIEKHILASTNKSHKFEIWMPLLNVTVLYKI